MNKLQLYMNMSQGGSCQTMVETNADDYTRQWVDDLRRQVEQVGYSVAEKAVFYMLRYTDCGAFMVVIRTIPRVRGNHLASWIFIPYSLRISDAQVASVVDFVARKVSQPEVNAKDVADIKDLFSQAYPEDADGARFAPSEGSACAYRYYGAPTGDTLGDLIGRYRYQTAYLPFSGVLLVDHDITSDVEGSNLTSAPLDEMAVLLPPPPATPRSSASPSIYGQPFDAPYYVPMGASTTVAWKMADGHEVNQEVYVAQKEMRAPAMPQTSHEEHQPPLAAQPDGPTRKKTYHFQIPAKSAAIGTVIEFEITTSGELEGSPIDGYEPTADIQEGAGRSNHLLYKSDSLIRKVRTRGIWAAGGFLVGLLTGLLCTCGSDKPQPARAAEPVPVEQPQPAADAKPAQPAPDTLAATKPQEAATKPAKAEAEAATDDRSLEAAVRYLDSNDTWDKAEMEKYPDLRGLYDDMNNIERRKLVEEWGPKLKESRRFTKNIVHHSRLSYKKTARRKPFNSPEKTTIYIQSYLNCIDP